MIIFWDVLVILFLFYIDMDMCRKYGNRKMEVFCENY